MDRVYLLQHSYEPRTDCEVVKVIGAYRTREEAVEAVARLKGKPGFRNHPNLVDPDVGASDEGFHISEMVLGRDAWVDGFVSWSEAIDEG
ncbi:MAG: hypothetical protein JNL93_16895 [Pelomonas sp.]|nr:hypothetical protein [Roseateles sp.]